MAPNRLHITSLQKDFLDFDKNLAYLKDIVLQNNHKKTLIVAPEVYLSGFDYDTMHSSAQKSNEAIKELSSIAEDVIIVLSIVVENEGKFYNQAIVINRHKIIYKQEKTKLFKLGDEHKYFIAGNKNTIASFEIDGIRFAILICFEIRFKELWEKIEGVDVVCVPAKWGVLREHHMEVLTKALAVMNQCFVVVSSVGDESIAKASMIISPDAKVFKDKKKEFISEEIEIKEVLKMRRYIDMGN
jgi:predicted amidohydrolase